MKKNLYLSIAIGLSLIASQLIVFNFALAADPQFNTFTPYTHTQTYNRDYYLLDVKNDTKGTDWNFPVSADAGDVLSFYVYYHNSANNTTANNTTLRINLPNSQNTQQNITAYLWADNVSNATANNPLTQSVSINLSSNQTIQYVSGSAKWFPNQANWKTASPTSFPNGQSGDQLFSSGINIGSINGCWEFSGAVIFQARVSSAYPAPIFSNQNLIVKRVNNLTFSNGTETDNNASVGDILKYSIVFTNNNSSALNNLQILDILPSYAVFQSVDNNGYYDSSRNQIAWNFNNLAPGASVSVSYQVKVQNIPYNNFVITNTAAARLNNDALINSNEVHTTIAATIATASVAVKAITGSNSLNGKMAISLMASLWMLFFFYIFTEHPKYWRQFNFRLKMLKIRIAER